MLIIHTYTSLFLRKIDIFYQLNLKPNNNKGGEELVMVPLCMNNSSFSLVNTNNSIL
jgi:hypothetical protein